MKHWTVTLAWLLLLGIVPAGLLADELLCWGNQEKTPQADDHVEGKVLRYAQRVVGRYDADDNGRLAASEWGQMRGDPRLADSDGDGEITVAEFAGHVADYGRQRKICLIPRSQPPSQPIPPLLHPAVRENGPAPTEGSSDRAPSVPASLDDLRRQRKFFVPRARLPDGLPDWFLRRDANGDGQLTRSEYAPEGTTSRSEQFDRYDTNSDGLLTAHEYVRAASESKPGRLRP